MEFQRCNPQMISKPEIPKGFHEWLRASDYVKRCRLRVPLTCDGRERFYRVDQVGDQDVFVELWGEFRRVSRAQFEEALRSVGSTLLQAMDVEYRRWIHGQLERKRKEAEAEEEGAARERPRRELLKRIQAITQRALKDEIDLSPLHYPFPIDARDVILCSKWADRPWARCSPYEQTRLLSARIAEKAAGRFYQSVGSTVHDVSLGQITNENTDWKSFDILADKRSIDVKNARRPRHKDDGYSWFEVPEFKYARDDSHVHILAVLSPYLLPAELTQYNGDLPSWRCTTLTILGETNRPTLKALANILNAEDLLTSSFQSTGDTSAHLPAWAFSVPTV